MFCLQWPCSRQTFTCADWLRSANKLSPCRTMKTKLNRRFVSCSFSFKVCKLNAQRSSFCFHLTVLLDDIACLSSLQGGKLISNRPHLRLLDPNFDYYDEVSNDALSIRGFQEYRCNDYHLGANRMLCFLRYHSGFSLMSARVFDKEQRECFQRVWWKSRYSLS